MKDLVIVGSGKEGKGNLGDMFCEAGNYHLTFLDKDPAVIDALNSNGVYTVEAFYADHNETREISGYEAYLLDDDHKNEDVLVNTDLVMLALYPEDIPDAARFLTAALQRRIAKNPEKKLSIVSCTNKNHIMPHVYKVFTEGLDADEKAWFNNNVALRDMIVRRSANASSPADLHLTTKVIETLLVQKPLNVDISDVKWLELVDDLEDLKDIKLFTRNGPHATCAYAGYYKGYKTIAEGKEDPEVKKLMDDVLTEAIAGIKAEYSNAQTKLDIFLADLDEPAEEEPELISRVGFDPLRKLAKGDRLTGNAEICEKHGLKNSALIHAIAYGLCYDNPDDESAVEMQNLLHEKEIEEAISHIIGLTLENPITQKVIAAYRNLTA